MGDCWENAETAKRTSRKEKAKANCLTGTPRGNGAVGISMIAELLASPREEDQLLVKKLSPGIVGYFGSRVRVACQLFAGDRDFAADGGIDVVFDVFGGNADRVVPVEIQR